MPLLRAHVVRRSEDHTGRRDVALEPELTRQTEVDEGGAAVLTQHHVAGLDVPVQDADRMQRAERTGHLAQEPERLAPWQG